MACASYLSFVCSVFPLYPLVLFWFIGTDCLEWSVCASAMAFYTSFHIWPLRLLRGLLEGGLSYVSRFRSAMIFAESKDSSVILYK
jgi:hypothetical protein